MVSISYKTSRRVVFFGDVEGQPRGDEAVGPGGDLSLPGCQVH